MRARERTSSENGRPDGTRSCGIADTHEAAPRFFLDGHFGNDGNAHAGSYHAEQAAELATFKNNLRVKACPVARRNGGIAKAVAITQKQKWLGAQVFERERAALC